MLGKGRLCMWMERIVLMITMDCLDDNKTEVSVTENVKTDVLLRAPDKRRVTAIVNFCVWDMPGINMILGVLVILDYFLVVLMTVLETA